VLTSHGGGVYVIAVARPLIDVWYRLELVAVDSGSLTSSTFLDIFVDDDASDALRFSRPVYRATLSTAILPGTCVTTVSLTGHHPATTTYRRLDDGALGDVIQVGRRTGRICTRSWLPCDSPTIIRLAILAYDWSRRSVAVAVQLKIERPSGTVSRRPSFVEGFYHANVDENVPLGHCLLTVSTTFLHAA